MKTAQDSGTVTGLGPGEPGLSDAGRTGPCKDHHPAHEERAVKVSLLHRVIAKFVDLLIAAALAQLLPPVGWIAAGAYLLLADGLWQGQSLGKRLIGLQVRVESRPGRYRESIVRNTPIVLGYLCLGIPYAGWLLAAAILVGEGLLLLGSPQGQRLGDLMASTTVVEQEGQGVSAERSPSPGGEAVGDTPPQAGKE